MSFLGGRGPTAEEVARETYIKKNITETLGLALKSLQQRHVNSEEPIYSEDSANTVCNIIEAVFLHGLKSSFTHKLSSYLIGVDPGKNLQPCFWELLTRFSHKDVISQLNHLGQITTEIGMCRAWIRMALNDGVLESYLDAILIDSGTIRHFYKRTAYLRDDEHAGIMKSYIQGLLAFTFQLSYNSSVLNLWTTTPLVMAGLMEQTVTPHALMPTSRSDGAISRRTSDDRDGAASEAISVNRGAGRARESNRISSLSYDDNLRRVHHPKTPPNSPFDMSGLSRADIEEIRKFAEQARSSGSASTPTSQISCPDYAVDRHFLSPGSETEGSDAVTIHAARRSERIENDLLRAFGAVREEGAASDVLVTKSKRSKQKTKSDRSSDSRSTDTPSAGQKGNQPQVITNTGSGATGGADSSFVDRTEDQPDSAQDDTPAAASASGVTAPAQSKPNRRESFPKIPPPEHIFHGKSPPLQPVLSTATATEPTQVEVAKEAGPTMHFSSDSDDAVLINADGEEEYGIYDSYGPSPQGNKLGAMQGWSSEFQEQQAAFGRVSEEHPMEVSGQDGRIQSATQQESYGALLQNYVPGPLNAPSMSQVLDELPESRNALREVTQQDSPEEDLTYLEEYEVVSVGTNVTSSQADVRTQQLVSLIGVICNEKGLDQQSYQCKGCSRPVGMIYGKARVCEYDGGYYCYECHENEEYYIPSLIVHNWDLRKHKVARHTLQFLRQVENNPLINIQKINPRLYDHVPDVKTILELRTQLRFLKAYLFTCKQTVADELRRLVWPKEYLYDDIHLYALQDILQVPSGQLAAFLRKLIKYATKHVYECRLCSQKGFICEVCDKPKVIYPFQVETTSRCDQCNAVFHKDCKPLSKPCPKCERRKQRQMKYGNDRSTPDTIDYAYTCDHE